MSKKESNENEKYVLGMIGLGTMGRNLLLNMSDHGYAVSGFDVDPEKLALLEADGKDADVKGFNTLAELVERLETPKTIMLLVPAGTIVDSVIQELLPLIDKGDIIIDAGNSHFTDTNRRVQDLENKGIHFFGMGISGGEEGARHGPSMMPGGDKEAYEVVRPILEAISAKVKGEPCVSYIGPGASGHFVKMVHNGIEYGLMELIAETYEILKKGLNLSNKEIHQVFRKWNEGRLQSYLLEISCDIFAFKEPGTDHLLLDDIKDEAKAKGTGKWTSQIAMDLTLPIPMIDTAVSMRDMSKYKGLRVQASSLYSSKKMTFFQEENKFSFIEELEDAFCFAMVITYAQGMHLLSKASEEYQYQLKLDQIAKIWRGGCIIRSKFLETIYDAFQKDQSLTHLLLDSTVELIIKKNLVGLQSVVISAVSHGVAIPAYASSLCYFDTLRSEKMPSNLIQAQRDFFGAHTYERIGKEGVFHTQWDNTVTSNK
jgi:6-phosphogluconate dehydrogenase